MRPVFVRSVPAISLLLLLAASSLAQESNRPVVPGKGDPRSPASIERYLQYYLELYNDNLKSTDWMARAMGVISLAKLDDPRMTKRLLEVLKKDDSPIVRVFAFEALHARQERLDANTRAEWVRVGLDLGDSGAFRGDLRVGYVRLLGEAGPTAENKKRFMRTFETTNSLHPGDIRTLSAMASVLNDWQSPEIVRNLIGAMGKLENAYRAQLVLNLIGTSVPHCSLWQSEGSQGMWAKAQQQWAEWLQKADLKEVAPGKCPPYKDATVFLPPGEVIADTSEPRWRKDLELPKFRLAQLDVGIALDTTGSMTAPLEWVKQDVIKMMRMFELISREPRIGITLYRDQGDAFVTKTIPLTDNANFLAKVLRKEGAKGGGDIPEAILEGLTEVVKNQKWSGGSARKIVLLIGDAPPHEETLKQIEALVTESAKGGFSFYTIKVQTDHRVEEELKKANYDPQLETFDKIAQWGDGNSFWVNFERHNVSPQSTSCAQPTEEDSPDRLIFREVLTAALNKGYRDRVGPFVRVLLEFVDESPREWRQGFPKAPPPQVHDTGNGRGPRPPAPPRPPPPDPQGR